VIPRISLPRPTDRPRCRLRTRRPARKLDHGYLVSEPCIRPTARISPVRWGVPQRADWESGVTGAEPGAAGRGRGEYRVPVRWLAQSRSGHRARYLRELRPIRRGLVGDAGMSAEGPCAHGPPPTQDLFIGRVLDTRHAACEPSRRARAGDQRPGRTTSRRGRRGYVWVNSRMMPSYRLCWECGAPAAGWCSHHGLGH
jgi:hypothetical protein